MKTTIEKIITNLYEDIGGAEMRLQRLLSRFVATFDSDPDYFVSTPGRTEIGGNHTDHNNGKVIAASINLDSIGWFKSSDSNRVTLLSDGYPRPFELTLDNIKPHESEVGSTEALIRGVAARLYELGYKIGGFQACIASDVLAGSGLSSSASIEVLIGSIFNILFNENSIDPETLAKVGQFAENNFFGKPCGLMDQMACAVGGIIAIDFEHTEEPQFSRIPFDFAAQDYNLIIVDTGGSHADLTDDYAAIPTEMRAVAQVLGKAVLREVDEQDIYAKLNEIRTEAGDRAVLRAMHFMQENKRVDQMKLALESSDFGKFLDVITASGHSSYRWLQNINAPKSTSHQGVALALALTEQFIENHGVGATRIHGGGFAGTIQVFLPKSQCADYRTWMNKFAPDDAIYELQIRQKGTWAIAI